MEEQKRQTVERILNEAGRKQKQRKEREEQKLKEKTNHKYRKLPEGDIVVRYKTNKDGSQLLLDRRLDAVKYLGITSSGIYQEVKSEKKSIICSNGSCGKDYKYKIPKGNLFACSLECYKALTNSNKE